MNDLFIDAFYVELEKLAGKKVGLHDVLLNTRKAKLQTAKIHRGWRKKEHSLGRTPARLGRNSKTGAHTQGIKSGFKKVTNYGPDAFKAAKKSK
jgi:hypothetical protein